MDIFAGLSLLGGLALFLFGMDTMGDGLVKISGGKLEKILGKLTSKRFMALITGAMVTAVIQSSSATTVMVVGFVNSGIMELGQAVGIIMGANIGTTITSWLLSLTGIQGDNVFIKLLKPSSFSPILAAIGTVLTMTAKDGSKNKDIGRILLGFAVLMFGMETMSDSVKPLAENEAFTGILLKFSNPVLGMLAGAGLTAVIQSSSASVGILQALCATGAVGYSAALPIIMGQNIGTCVTALISSVGASTNARRASMIHLYFNMIGTVFFMTVFYTIDRVAHFAFMDAYAGAAGIAVIHSCFNIGCAVLLFPFADKLVKLASLTVPQKPEDDQTAVLPKTLQALDRRFLETPSFAINLCKDAVDEMAVMAKEAFDMALSVPHDDSRSLIQAVKDKEELLDLYDDYLGSYLVKLSGSELSKADSHTMSKLLHCINDFERISDHAKNISETWKSMNENNISFSAEAMTDIENYTKALKAITSMTLQAFVNNDAELAKEIEPLEEVIDAMCIDLKSRHILRMREGSCIYESSMYFEDILTDFERVSDHCSNIAISIIEIDANEFDPHSYLKNIVKKNSSWFEERVRAYASEYSI